MGYVDEGASSIEVWILTISSYYSNVTAKINFVKQTPYSLNLIHWAGGEAPFLCSNDTCTEEPLRLLCGCWQQTSSNLSNNSPIVWILRNPHFVCLISTISQGCQMLSVSSFLNVKHCKVDDYNKVFNSICSWQWCKNTEPMFLSLCRCSNLLDLLRKYHTTFWISRYTE